MSETKSNVTEFPTELTKLEHAVLKAMVPEQPITAEALAKKVEGLEDRASSISPTLSRLRAKGWVKYDKPTKGKKYKWYRCRERLIVPQEPGQVRRNKRKEPVPDQVTVAAALEDVRQAMDEAQKRLDTLKDALAQQEEQLRHELITKLLNK